ncbi:hypothetical protein OG625_39755 (plasmid) [Streptomyces sp. NBC_01351]|uniref:hypothetical protein n=1 Tax=Streptomyces sp. NBC_01351 TaxID=2903833 RepID=UPI002E37FCFC|nr:hypothetical protein [Streptomyces sp. NBC_01351]
MLIEQAAALILGMPAANRATERALLTQALAEGDDVTGLSVLRAGRSTFGETKEGSVRLQ